MSHNILKVNTNSFDVNSNQSLSTSHTTIETFRSIPIPNTSQWVYPRTPAAGQNYLFYSSTLNNNITGCTYSNYTGNWLETITLSTDGVYRLNARTFISMNTSTSVNGILGTYWYDITNSTILGNSMYFQENAYNYTYNGAVSGIVEVSGTPKTIAVRIFAASHLDASAHRIMQWYDRLLIERLQD